MFDCKTQSFTNHQFYFLSLNMAIESLEENSLFLIKSLKEDTKIIENAEKTQYTLKLASGEHLLVKDKFSSLPLDPKLLKGIYELGYEKPSIIQGTVIPLIIDNTNLVVQSKSGTGKTLAFVAPLLNILCPNKKVQAIILTPTKELNQQIGQLTNELAQVMNLSTYITTSKENVNDLSEIITNEIIIGSPGSILSLMQKGKFDISKLKMFIIDEADACLEYLGSQTCRIMKRLSDDTQKIFFSATYNNTVKSMITRFAKNVKELYEENSKPKEILLFYMDVKRNEKLSILLELYEYLSIGQMIVFANSRNMVEILKREFEGDMHKVSAIHGEMDVEVRNKTVDDFRNAHTKILVCTDVFSRGMDIPQVNLVVNYDLPVYRGEVQSEKYIHRIGRSGRFGRSGFIIDFVSGKEDFDALVEIQRRLETQSRKISVQALRDAFYKIQE